MSLNTDRSDMLAPYGPDLGELEEAAIGAMEDSVPVDPEIER